MPTISNLSIRMCCKAARLLTQFACKKKYKIVNKYNYTLFSPEKRREMSMIPFFPNLKPSVANRFWFDMANDDEVQTKRYEDERRNWRESLKTAATDLQPLGKVLTMPGIETDDEDANDDSEDTDSHDEEDDETNDRVIPVTQDFYSADDIQMNDETSPTAP